MASSHFVALDANLFELKRIYLDAASASFSPTAEQQEMARAFVIFAHAELEWFVEKACSDFADVLLNEAGGGKFSASTLSLLTFSSLDPVNGGASLGKKAASRSLNSRVGDAVAKLKVLADGNDGLREKHLAKMLVPLGLHSNHVDASWLADLDAFCSSRGAFAHMSRSMNQASHLAVNPADVWKLCSRLVWGASPGSNLVSSFQDLDDWILTAGQSFMPVALVLKPKSFWGRLLGR